MKTGADMGHIYLTGMMGSGKSAIGRTLSRKLHLRFADLDVLIEKGQKKTINEMFSQDGEPAFRRIETETLRSVSRETERSVVSCGGGIVLSDENIRIMHDTGTIVLVFRDVEAIIKTINTKKRPLLREGAENVRRIFQDRAERYEASCDIRIVNDGTIEEAAEKIISLLALR